MVYTIQRICYCGIDDIDDYVDLCEDDAKFMTEGYFGSYVDAKKQLRKILLENVVRFGDDRYVENGKIKPHLKRKSEEYLQEILKCSGMLDELKVVKLEVQ
jgi:hypothetical protein